MSTQNEAWAPGGGLTVAEMAAVTGLTARTLRWYERVGLIRPISHTSGGTTGRTSLG